MSLAVAVPCGLASALAYGVATAVQHSAAHRGTGDADVGGLVRLLRDPRWLMSIGGDAVGLVLQVIALATGPVVLIQPLLVLALPVSLPVSWALGGPRPARNDYLACASIIGGLALFFALIGDPGTGHPMTARSAAIAAVTALACGVVLCLAVRRTSPTVRALTYGAVSGAWFGLVGVMLKGCADQWLAHGLSGFGQPEGLVPLVAVLVVGASAITLLQISFQVGALSASFPANKSADPLTAVVLGAILLGERVPVGPGYLAAYLVCLVAIVLGAVQLAG